MATSRSTSQRRGYQLQQRLALAPAPAAAAARATRGIPEAFRATPRSAPQTGPSQIQPLPRTVPKPAAPPTSPPGYAFSSRAVPSTASRARRPDAIAIAAAKLDLTRTIYNPSLTLHQGTATQLTARETQRPWTVKEFEFLRKIEKGIDDLAMQAKMFEFRVRFGWTPSIGQMRSQWWLFKGRSEGEMRVWLQEEGRRGNRV